MADNPLSVIDALPLEGRNKRWNRHEKKLAAVSVLKKGASLYQGEGGRKTLDQNFELLDGGRYRKSRRPKPPLSSKGVSVQILLHLVLTGQGLEGAELRFTGG